jgi:hypothetical protein
MAVHEALVSAGRRRLEDVALAEQLGRCAAGEDQVARQQAFEDQEAEVPLLARVLRYLPDSAI